jgi:hypothetical protein
VRRRGAAAAAVVDRGAAAVLVDRGAAGGAGDRGRRERWMSGSGLGRPRSSRVRAEAEPSRAGVAGTRAGNESIDYLLGGGGGGGGLRVSGALAAAAPRGGCFASEGEDDSCGRTWNERRWSDAVTHTARSHVLPDGPCNGLHAS